MQAGWYWVCPHCQARNKAFAAVCLSCSRERPAGAVAVEHGSLQARGPATERFRVTRPVRWALIGAAAMAIVVAALLVRTFRAPALEASGSETEAAPAPGGLTVTQPAAPPAAVPPPAFEPPAPTPSAADTAPPAPAFEGSTRGYAPAPRAAGPPRSRAYTDADLRRYAASRGAAAASDPSYRLALRQRRVDDLRRRLDAADSAQERETLRLWLDDALRDLERERGSR